VNSDDHAKSRGQKYLAGPYATERPMQLMPFAGASDELTLADIWRVLLKRRWIIGGFIVLGVVAAALFSFSQKPKYESLARIAIGYEGNDLFGNESGLSFLAGSDMETKIETQVRILQSEPLATEVIRKLKLDSNPDFFTPERDASPEATRQGLLGTFRSGLSVAAVPKTELVEIRYRSTSAKLSADVVATLVDAYIERNFRVKYESTMQASDWLQKQLGDLKQNVERTQEKLSNFEKAHGVVFLGADESKNSTITKLDELSQKLAAAQSERIMREAAYRTAEGGNPELMANIVPGSPLQILRAQEAEIQNQYAQTSAKYGDAYPKVRQLRAQLEQVQTSITREVKNTSQRLRNEYLASRRTEDMLRQEVDKSKQEAFQLNEGAVQYTILRREFESSRDLYESLTKKLKEAGITAGLRSTNVTQVDPATMPLTPSEPKVPRNLGIGLGIGLFLGIIAAAVIESLDSSLRSIEEVESYSGLPSLAVVPNARLSRMGYRRLIPSSVSDAALPGKVELVTLHRPKSQVSESFRTLRSSLLLSCVDAPPRSVLITSSVPGEGKSTASMNSAIVMAQNGGRVLLVDADLRRPGLHDYFGIPNEAGLTSVIAGTAPFEKAAVPCPQLQNLWILPAGPAAPYPAELLGSRRMAELLSSWRENFDAVVIDSPPVLSVTDAVVLAPQVDTVLLVLHWGHTGWQALRRARDLLVRAQARIAGVVVNNVKMDAPEGYGYYGSYGRKYDRYYDEAIN